MAAAGAVSAKDTGVRPSEARKSTLVTRPSSAGGTRVCMSVLHTTLPTARHAPSAAASGSSCQLALATAKPHSAIGETDQAAYMSEIGRRPRPTWPTSAAEITAPSPLSASTSP